MITNSMTFREMLTAHHEMMMADLWFFFWLSIVIHIFLGLILPALRHGVNEMRLYFKQNLQDHVEIAQMVKKARGE